ncbi:MAG: metallophosphoesterase [Oligoflexales bacterium]
MKRILHISDLHFGPWFNPAPAQGVLRFCEDTRPDCIIISGDLTQRAKPREFEQVREYLASLNKFAKTIVVPGNHDIPLYRVWERAFSPYGLYRKFVNKDLNGVHVWDDVGVVAVNSTHPYLKITEGRYNQQLDELCNKGFGAAASDSLRVLVMHHNLMPFLRQKRVKLPHRSKLLLEILNRHKIDILLSGHAHQAYILEAVDLFSSYGTTYDSLIVNCGTTTSLRGRGNERQKNTLNIIVTTESNIEIAHHMFDAQSGRFLPASTHRFPRATRL